MKSCENCRYTPRTHGCISGITCIDFSQHKPDYPTLERENAELELQIEKLQNEKSAYELLYHTAEKHFTEDVVKNQKRIAELTQALERAVDAVDCPTCPLQGFRCPMDNHSRPLPPGYSCKPELLNHFKEAAQ